MGTRYVIREEDESAGGAVAGIVIAVIIMILIIYIILAIVAVWCLISSIACYSHSIKENCNKEYDGSYSFGKGFYDFGYTIKGYWNNIIEYSGECFDKNLLHKTIGIFIYPLGFVYFLIFIILHFITLLFYCSIKTIFSNK